MVNTGCRCHIFKALVLLSGISFATGCLGEDDIDVELLLFPFLDAHFNSNLDSTTSPDNHDYDYGIDLFATFEYKKIRFLGEYLLSKEERELERLQLGLLLSNNNRLWVGRYHNPLGYWNTQYHHGDYLEAGVVRPALINFEDEGGLLPMHLGGLLYEGLIEEDSYGLGYALAVGVGPEFKGELEPWDVLEPGSGQQNISTTINLYYEPQLFGENRYGLFAGFSKIPAELPGINEIRQLTAGLYVNWESTSWHVLSALYYIHNHLNLSGAATEGAFVNAYFQVARELNSRWTLYGRMEGTAGDKNDPYLALFPNFIENRLLGGIRFDVFHQHALKLEFSKNYNDIDDFFQINLQWSAVF